jgi:hypothetical protein
MQRRWLSKNVDLAILADRTVQLLEANEFDVTELKTEKGYEIVAGESSKYKISRSLLITIEGKPEEFLISLELDKEGEKERFRFPVMLTAMMGGGYFLLKQLKSDEAWMNFGKDFWKEIDRLITGLRGSAIPSRSS